MATTVGSAVAAPVTSGTQNTLGTQGAGVAIATAGSFRGVGLEALLQPALLRQLIIVLAVLAGQQVVGSQAGMAGSQQPQKEVVSALPWGLHAGDKWKVKLRWEMWIPLGIQETLL